VFSIERFDFDLLLLGRRLRPLLGATKNVPVKLRWKASAGEPVDSIEERGWVQTHNRGARRHSNQINRHHRACGKISALFEFSAPDSKNRFNRRQHDTRATDKRRRDQ
jgi:hypothetical protein